MTYFYQYLLMTNWLHSSFTRSLWLGGNKSDSGIWTWADGDVISWVRWAPDALEEEAGPRFLLLEPDTGNMTSQAPEDERAYFVCEVEMAGEFIYKSVIISLGVNAIHSLIWRVCMFNAFLEDCLLIYFVWMTFVVLNTSHIILVPSL